MSAIQITTIAPEEVTSGVDFIECKPFVAKLTAAGCALRQERARVGDERVAPCAKCDVGKLVSLRLNRETAPPPKCEREGCDRDADEGSEFCAPHARAMRARKSRVRGEKRDMAHYQPNPGTCTAEGCPSPRAGLPSRVEGGETLCRRHRQLLRMEQMRAAGLPASGRADLLDAVIAKPQSEPCSQEGCDRPRSLKPTDIEGGESLCGRHRGVLAAVKAKKARREAKEAAAPVVAKPKPAPLADVPTVPMGPEPALSEDKPIPYRLTEPPHEAVAAATAEALASITPLPDVKPRAGALRVYIAAPKAEVMRARRVAALLRASEGVQVMSKWHDIIDEGAEDPAAYAELKGVLDANMGDLMPSHIVLALTLKGYGAGVYGEIGRAIAWKKQVIWSIERGGTSQDFSDDRVIASPTDDDAIRTIRALSEWRRAA